MATTGFGGSYKTAPACKSEQKVQELMYRSAGLEEVDKMWTAVMELWPEVTIKKKEPFCFVMFNSPVDKCCLSKEPPHSSQPFCLYGAILV
eukprot:4214761-Amphidinium_carterae.3